MCFGKDSNVDDRLFENVVFRKRCGRKREREEEKETKNIISIRSESKCDHEMRETAWKNE